MKEREPPRGVDKKRRKKKRKKEEKDKGKRRMTGRRDKERRKGKKKGRKRKKREKKRWALPRSSIHAISTPGQSRAYTRIACSSPAIRAPARR